MNTHIIYNRKIDQTNQEKQKTQTLHINRCWINIWKRIRRRNSRRRTESSFNNSFIDVWKKEKRKGKRFTYLTLFSLGLIKCFDSFFFSIENKLIVKKIDFSFSFKNLNRFFQWWNHRLQMLMKYFCVCLFTTHLHKNNENNELIIN